jgi:hypothetical protein
MAHVIVEHPSCALDLAVLRQRIWSRSWVSSWPRVE